MDLINDVKNNEVFSYEFVVNVENVRITFLTQESALQSYKPPMGTVMHFHTGYELFLCAEGELYIRVGDDKLTLRQGELLFVPPKVSHSILGYTSASSHNSLYFFIASNGQKSSFDLYRIISKVINDSCSIIPDMGELSGIIKDFRLVMEKRNLYETSFYAHRFLMKIVELTGNIPQEYEGTYSDNSNLRVHNIHLFIHSHLSETISLEDLASLLRLSVRQTSRVINDKFGCSFKELVTKIRMEKAGKLLLENEFKVSEVADMVGYSSERGFYTAFRKHFGCLPKEYRKKFSDNSLNEV